MNVEDLVKNPDKCDELLEVLNEIARDIDAYEFGLPLYDDGSKARLREAIYQWACGGLVPQPETVCGECTCNLANEPEAKSHASYCPAFPTTAEPR